MAGLFDGNYDEIVRMLQGVGAGGLTPGDLTNSAPAQMPMVEPPAAIEPPGSVVNPNPVTTQAFAPTEPPVSVPLPRPAPPALSATPAAIAAANSGAGAVPLGLQRPALNPDLIGPGKVGEALLPPESLGARAPAAGAEGPVAPNPAEANAQAPGGRPSLAQALKGTTGIKPPEVQKISSPNAPRATGTIKSGELQALLMALNAGGAAPGKPVRLGG